MKQLLRPWLVGLLAVGMALAIGASVVFGSSDGRRGSVSDKALESALLAPCCYGGTLGNHDSELARQLRSEIETRFAGGESTESIETDLVGRYGARIRAMPNERAFHLVPALAAAIAFLGIAALALLVRRWRREPPRSPAAATPRGPRDDYDARIDAELAEAD